MNLDQQMSLLESKLKFTPDELTYQLCKRDDVEFLELTLAYKSDTFVVEIFDGNYLSSTTESDSSIQLAMTSVVESTALINAIIRQWNLTNGAILDPDFVLTNVISFFSYNKKQSANLFDVPEMERLTLPVFEVFSERLLDLILKKMNRPKRLYWDVYRPHLRSISENCIFIEGGDKEEFQIRIHVTGTSDLPALNNSAEIDINVCDQTDAHHLVLWLADKLKLDNLKTLDGQIAFDSA